ncbi:hypothetical protein ACFGWO_09945 [Pasteurella multocida]
MATVSTASAPVLAFGPIATESTPSAVASASSDFARKYLIPVYAVVPSGTPKDVTRALSFASSDLSALFVFNSLTSDLSALLVFNSLTSDLSALLVFNPLTSVFNALTSVLSALFVFKPSTTVLSAF